VARRLRQFLTIGLAVISLGGCGLMQG